MLVRRGKADTNIPATTPTGQTTALSVAVAKGHTSIARLLIKRGATESTIPMADGSQLNFDDYASQKSHDGGKMAAFLADRRCTTCHLLLKSRTERACAGCRKVWYCNVECQSAHWAEHKPACIAARKKAADEVVALVAAVEEEDKVEDKVEDKLK